MDNNLKSKDLHTNFEELEKSPLFHFSLHSKELFHSNFLAWMAKDEAVRPLFKKVLVGIGVDEKVIESWGDEFEVVREERNLDILIKAKDADVPTWYVVIENKVKSIPTSKQLETYTETIKNADNDPLKVKKILLTLAKYNGNLPEGWQQVSYKQILDVLTEHQDKISDSYQKRIVEDYTTMLQQLIDIVECYTVSWDDSFLLKKYNEDLQKLRIDDLVGKLRAAQMVDLFRTTYLSENNSENAPMCTQNYTNKQPLIEVYKFMKDKDEKELEQVTFGVQIQGNQYRHCVITNANEDEIPEASFGFLCEGRDVFRNKMLKKYPGVFKEKAVKGEKGRKFCSYNKNKKGRTFWYQYVTIKDDVTVRKILECMAADLKDMEEIKRTHFGR